MIVMKKEGACSPGCVLALCTSAYTTVYLARLNVSIASPLFQQAGIMDNMQIGLMGSLFFIVYAAGRVINGYMGDTMSAKKLLLAGMLATAAANLGIGLLPPVPVILFLWGVNGLAQSMLWGPSLRLVNDVYAGSPFGRLAAVILSASVGAGSLAAILLSSLLAHLGVRWLFIIPGLIVLAAAVSLLALPADEQPALRPSLRSMAARPKMRGMLRLLLPAAAHGAVKENLVLWAPLLFMAQYGVDLKAAAFFALLMPAAMLLGRIAYPLIARWCGWDEAKISIWSFAACVLGLAPFFFWNPPIPLAAVLLALAALAVSVINVAYTATYPLRYEKTNQVSMAAGVLDGMTYLGSAVGSLLFGWLVDAAGYLSVIGFFALISLASIGTMLPAAVKRKKTPGAGVSGSR